MSTNREKLGAEIQRLAQGTDEDWWEAVDLVVENAQEHDVMRELLTSKQREAVLAVLEAVTQRRIPGISEHILGLLAARNEEIKGAAIRAVGALAVEGAVEPLLRLLKDSRFEEDAASALGQIGALEAVEQLRAKVSAEPSPGHEVDHTGPIRALGQIGGPDAVAALLMCLEGRPDLICGEAAHALGELGDVSAVEPLIAAFESLPAWSQASWRIIEAIGRIGDARGRTFLESLLADERHKELHDEVRDALR